MTTLERAFCPYCFVVVEIRDGVLIPHTVSRVHKYAGWTGKPCKGSGKKP